MSHKKRRNSSSNKSKGKNKAAASIGSIASEASTQPNYKALARNLANLSSTVTFSIKKVTPDDYQEAEEEGYYEIYKKSTTRFCNWMKETCIPKFVDRMTGVNGLRKGANRILEDTIAIAEQGRAGSTQLPIIAPPEVMSDLCISIQYRERFISLRFGSTVGGNQGHWYMIDALKYCHSVLTFSRNVAKAVLATKIDHMILPAPQTDEGDAVELLGAVGG